MFRLRAKIAPLDLARKRKDSSSDEHDASPSSTASDTRSTDFASTQSRSPQKSPLTTRLSSSSQRALKLILHKSRVIRVSQINGEPSPIFLTKESGPTYNKNKILPPTPDQFPASTISNDCDFPLPLTFGDLETWDPNVKFYYEDDEDEDNSPSSMVFTVGVDLDDEEPRFILIHQKQKIPSRTETTPTDAEELDGDEDEFPFEFVLTRSPNRWGEGMGEEGEEQNERPASPRTPLRPNLESKRQNRSGGLFKLSPVDGSFVQVTTVESLE